MNDPTKRDNAYWLGRLEKDGHADLLAQIEAGGLTVYKATQEAGYRKIGPSDSAARLSHHWTRADAKERKRFVYKHRHEINRLLRQMIDDGKQQQAQKPSE